MRIGAVLHPAVLVALSNRAGFLQHCNRPSAKCAGRWPSLFNLQHANLSARTNPPAPSCSKHARLDADAGEEVANEDIVNGFKADTDTFLEVTKEELENVELESTPSSSAAST
jgi:hypothetical protein